MRRQMDEKIEICLGACPSICHWGRGKVPLLGLVPFLDKLGKNDFLVQIKALMAILKKRFHLIIGTKVDFPWWHIKWHRHPQTPPNIEEIPAYLLLK